MPEVDAVIAVGVEAPDVPSALNLDLIPREQWAPVIKAHLRQYVRSHGNTLGLMTPEDGSHPEVAQLVETHFAQAAIDELTVVQKAPRFADNFLTTLMRPELLMATSLDSPLRGRPAFVVAAGPSLDRVGHLLPRCKELGHLIVVNTAVQAVLALGVEPDLVVCIESKTLEGHLDGYTGPVVLDVTAGDANTAAVAGEAWHLANNEPCLAQYVLELGAVPLHSGASVATAAAALAISYGASPVLLVGQDLGYPGGQVYGKHTPFGDITAAYADGVIQYTGTSKNLDRCMGVQAPAWGGDGTCITTHNLLHFAKWFERVCIDHLLIHTEGGVRIHGSLEVPLERALSGLTAPKAPPLPSPRPAPTAPVREALKRAAERNYRTGATCQPADMPLIGLWVIPATLMARREGLKGRDFLEAVTMAVDYGCERILEVLNG